MDVDQNEKYKDCAAYNKKCGSYNRHGTVDEIVKVKNFTLDVRDHLAQLKVQIKDKDIALWDEKRLIENRLYRILKDDESICSFHRYTLGIGWKAGKLCKHPEHAVKPGTKSAPGRPVPIDVLNNVNEIYQVSISMGSLFCFKHLKEEQKKLKEGADLEGADLEADDGDFAPDIPVVPIDVLDHSIEQGETLTTLVEASPIKFRLKRKVELIEDSTKRILRANYKRFELQMRKKYAECVAPGQSDSFISDVLDSSDSDENVQTIVPVELENYVEMYKESDSMAQLVILSLQDHSNYSINQLKGAFGCSSYRVKQARKLCTKGLVIPKKTKFTRNKLDLNKAEHFLDFVFTSGLLQDVAYGITRIKYDSGEEQKIAHAVLTTKFSHTISMYRESCIELNYPHLSERSLFRILEAIKPSQKKCLAGLDDISASGMNGFSMLQEISKQYNNRDLSNALERRKRYLKTRYPVHCAEDSKVASHSVAFALSDVKVEQLQVPTNISNHACKECLDLCVTLQSVEDLACQFSASEDILYDIKISINNIQEYIKHLMRDVQQKKAKAAVFDKLSEQCALWLKDFGQKILPVKFREGQKEYFGKKGMSLHVDVFFLKKNEVLYKHVYLTAIYRCDQNTSSVISLSEKVIDEFKKDEPEVTTLYTKSDNAGCYHGNFSAESMYEMCKKKDLTLLRYDFNEPCCGKDQCDRECAAGKNIIRSYIDSGNDLTTAEDIYTALHYGNGLKNAKVGVAEITDVPLKGKKIPNISNYHSIAFHEDHMTLWRYYDIGEGVTQPYSGISVEPTITMLKEYHSTDKRPGDNIMKMTDKRDDRKLCTLQFCQEIGCSSSFETTNELMEHELSGIHHVPKDVSRMDLVKKLFVGKMKGTHQSHTQNLGAVESEVVENDTVTNDLYTRFFGQKGWALPKRTEFRYSNTQKVLLYDYFIAGEESGRKRSPEEVHLMLRKDLLPDDYVTPQQIRSLFSRWSKLYREGKLKKPMEEEIDLENEDASEDNDHEDLIEYEEDLHELARNVINPWQIDDWVAIMFGDKWYPGVITKFNDEGTWVDCLTPAVDGKNCFRWPNKRDHIPYKDEEILCTFDAAPAPCSNRGDVKLFENDFNRAQSKMT